MTKLAAREGKALRTLNENAFYLAFGRSTFREYPVESIFDQLIRGHVVAGGAAALAAAAFSTVNVIAGANLRAL
ncbi:MAG: hypothetical protein NVS4B5_16080 [Vulcanimicrobiaceae bacterium]